MTSKKHYKQVAEAIKVETYILMGCHPQKTTPLEDENGNIVEVQTSCKLAESSDKAAVLAIMPTASNDGWENLVVITFVNNGQAPNFAEYAKADMSDHE